MVYTLLCLISNYFRNSYVICWRYLGENLWKMFPKIGPELVIMSEPIWHQHGPSNQFVPSLPAPPSLYRRPLWVYLYCKHSSETRMLPGIIQVQSKIPVVIGRKEEKDNWMGIYIFIHQISIPFLTPSMLINFILDFQWNASCYLPARLFSWFDDKCLMDLVNQSRQRILKKS